jgi:uncharacterized protein YndB with AHSA1/START domain
MTKTIEHEIRIKAPVDAVYAGLTDIGELSRWWIPDTRGTSQQGQNLEFWFGPDACQVMRVAHLEANREVRWEALASDLSDWKGTAVTFSLQASDTGTTLQFKHSGYDEEVASFGYYSTSWAVFMLSLKALLEEGTGFPFPNKWIHN